MHGTEKQGLMHHFLDARPAVGPTGALDLKDVVLDDERTRARGRRSTTSGTPAAPWAPKTWCLTTKEQGLAGGGTPRPVRRRRLGRQRRGARRRKNKGLRGAEHHVPQTAGALSSEDVVLDDERTRACGRRSTTSGTPAAPWAPKTWCLTTKEQGFAESEAPRPTPAAPRPAPEAHQKRTDAQSVPLIFLIYPTCLIYPAFQSIRLVQVSGLPR